MMVIALERRAELFGMQGGCRGTSLLLPLFLILNVSRND